MPTIRDRVKGAVPAFITEGIKKPLVSYGMRSAGNRPLPDFLIIGTKRGGTTSLWNYLVRHPLVPRLYPAWNTKTTHYFEENWRRGEAWYRSHFPTERARAALERQHGAPPKAGEAAPLYMFHPLAAGRVHQLMPNVRVIVLLRDPVERAYSHWKERTTEGKETLSFADALAAEDSRTTGEREKLIGDPNYFSEPYDWYTYRARGRYLEHLEPWLELFPSEQMLLLQSEQFYAEPKQAFAKVCRFIGLPEYDLGTYQVYNGRASLPIDEKIHTDLVDYFRPFNAALEHRLGVNFGWPA